MMKVCSYCQVIKPITNFYENKKRGYIVGRCKGCYSIKKKGIVKVERKRRQATVWPKIPEEVKNNLHTELLRVTNDETHSMNKMYKDLTSIESSPEAIYARTMKKIVQDFGLIYWPHRPFWYGSYAKVNIRKYSNWEPELLKYFQAQKQRAPRQPRHPKIIN